MKPSRSFPVTLIVALFFLLPLVARANPLSELVELAVSVHAQEKQSGFPPTLDNLPDGTTCAVATPCFATVLKTPLTLGSWSKTNATTYAFQTENGVESYVYNPQTGKLRCLICEPAGGRATADTVQSGINVAYAQNVINNPDKTVGFWPATLDTVTDNTECSFAAPCFAGVLQDSFHPKWQKRSATTYAYVEGDQTYIYVYDPAKGTFKFSPELTATPPVASPTPPEITN